MKLSIKNLRKSAKELITQCYVGKDLIESIELLRSAVDDESDSYKKISLTIPQIRRCEQQMRDGTISSRDYDVRINQIQISIYDFISKLKSKEILTLFEYDDKNGLEFYITNSQKEFKFRFIGNLRNYLPYGVGKAFYSNGSYYHGSFKNGLKEGEGILYDKNRMVINNGKWKNDNFLGKNQIRYYKHISVGANSKQNINIIDEPDFEIILLPFLNEVGLLAFPVKGDSMVPRFKEGDRVICKEITDQREIHHNQVYVVYHDQMFLLKYVQKDWHRSNRYVLVSENYLNHDPIEIFADEGTKFFKLVHLLKDY